MGEDGFAEGTVERREGMKFQMKHGKKNTTRNDAFALAIEVIYQNYSCVKYLSTFLCLNLHFYPFSTQPLDLIQ
jgi:hypothetical protein